MAAMTPMMAQYHEMKAKYPDAILFFRLGDFYEMFFEDALEASRLLQITLTSRSKGDNQAPMCGVPYHAALNYIAKLTKLGKKVAICEQLSDPNLPGIVKRDVVRVVTPGTTLDDNVLEQKCNNYVMAVLKNGDFELSYADITTGEFFMTTVDSVKNLAMEIERVDPSEIIIPVTLEGADFLKNLPGRGRRFIYTFESAATVASTFLMDYLQSTQKKALQHFQQAQPYDIADFMPLDEATLKNLELLVTLRENKKEGALLWVLDQTITAMGGRMLRYFLTHPLVQKEAIQLRLDAIEALVKNTMLLENLQQSLKSILDLERLMARLSLGQGNARDLIGLKASLEVIPEVKSLLNGTNAVLIKHIQDMLDPLPDIVALIEKTIVAEPPALITDGGMICEGYNSELDALRNISREGKSFIHKLQEEEIRITGINNLKVRFNSVFGYYIEISKAQTKNVPDYYIRKQTLVNAERYITPTLKEFEEKVLGAEEKIVALEQKLFQEVREKVVAEVIRIQDTAKNLALLDVMMSLASVAVQNNYCKPVIRDDDTLRIVQGRHPVVEKMSFAGRFIANDTELKSEGERFMLITGPNMGGKSTFLRQVALISLMAQIGSFVPAQQAEMGLVDHIFTRVGASDNLIRGQSTFMVEMQETAYILEHATKKSLVILDEIGRGTSTYDGMSIAWAITEYLHDVIQAKTLFATHYHELIALADKLPHASNYSVAVKETAEGITFLYKILAGGVDRSYGIEVAKLAGLPLEVTAKAKQILMDLEEGVVEKGIQQELMDSSKRVDEKQIGLFVAERAHEGIDRTELEALQKMDLNAMTPLEALQKLHEVQKKLKS